jgi:hypothetical protein
MPFARCYQLGSSTHGSVFFDTGPKMWFDLSIDLFDVFKISEQVGVLKFALLSYVGVASTPRMSHMSDVFVIRT